MKKGIILACLAILIMLVGYNSYTQNKLSVSDAIKLSVIDYLDKGIVADFLKDKDLEKLAEFKEKFKEEDFSSYKVEAYQPEKESVVYLMLIVEPLEPKTQGIVLYMNFHLKREYPIEIKELIISNWVVIEYDAKQF